MPTMLKTDDAMAVFRFVLLYLPVFSILAMIVSTFGIDTMAFWTFPAGMFGIAGDWLVNAGLTIGNIIQVGLSILGTGWLLDTKLFKFLK